MKLHLSATPWSAARDRARASIFGVRSTADDLPGDPGQTHGDDSRSAGHIDDPVGGGQIGQAGQRLEGALVGRDGAGRERLGVPGELLDRPLLRPGPLGGPGRPVGLAPGHYPWTRRMMRRARSRRLSHPMVNS